MGVPWPASLPAYPRVGVDYVPQPGVIRSENDTGPVNVRRRYTAVVTNVNWTMPPLTGDELQIYRDFVTNDLAGGALKIDMIDPTDDVVKEVRIIDPPGRIVGIVPNDLKGPRLWSVTMQIEFLP